MKTRFPSTGKVSGFTLTELMIVATIVVTIVALSIGAYRGTIYAAHEERIERSTRAVGNAKQFAISLNAGTFNELLEQERWDIIKPYITWPAGVTNLAGFFDSTDIERFYIRGDSLSPLFVRSGQPISAEEAEAVAEQARINSERSLIP